MAAMTNGNHAADEETQGISADQMDEERRHKMAYEYLCRLEEARNWIAECLKCELPATVELEESMRNGVVLAKLSNFFAPKIVTERKIFDADEQRYENSGLHFRHTDNIMQWRRAMNSVGLPEVFMPETTDVYDKKNMPRAVFCLHALSKYLNRRGLAPPIRDMTGKAAFKEEDIKMVADDLEKKGVKMPEFHKIDGMLIDELTPDQTKLHDAIRRINECLVNDEDTVTLLASLRDPNAQLEHVLEPLAQKYREKLTYLKAAKTESLNGHANDETQMDMYDLLLSHDEIQQGIYDVNDQHFLSHLEQCLQVDGDAESCAKLLSEPAFRLPNVHPQAGSLYLFELRHLRRSQDQALNHEQVSETVELVNAVTQVNQAVDSGDKARVLHALSNPLLQLKAIDDKNDKRYLRKMVDQKAKQDGRLLTWKQIRRIFDEANQPWTLEEQHADLLERCLAAVDDNDQTQLLALLHDAQSPLIDVQNDNLPLYRHKLAELLKKTQKTGNPLTFDDVQQVILDVNQDVLNALTSAKAVIAVNRALETDEPNHGEVYTTLEQNASVLKAPVRPKPEETLKTAVSVALWQERKNKKVEMPVPYHWHQFNADQSYPSVISIDRTTGECKVEQCDSPIDYSQDDWLSQRDIVEAIQNENKRFDEQNRQLTAAKKIQKFYRQNTGKKDYQELAFSDQPRLRVVRMFAQLLERTELDYEEELELETLKSELAAMVRTNRKLEENLRIMDVKIGLLVKNRLGVEDVMKHEKHLAASTSSHKTMENGDGPNQPTPATLRRSSTIMKAYQDRITACQHLLYHIQTEPIHLSKLLIMLTNTRIGHFIDSVLLPLFNHGSQRREEVLLLNVLKSTLKREVRMKVKTLESVNESVTVVPRIVSTWLKHIGDERQPLKQALNPLISKMLAEKQAKINTQPLEIYKYAVGDPPASLKPEEAALHPEVRAVLDETVEYLTKWAKVFGDTIGANVSHVPYVLRLMCATLRETLETQFPDATTSQLNKVVGRFLFDHYLNACITNAAGSSTAQPSGGGAAPGSSVNPNDRKKLSSVAKLLLFATLNKGYEAENEFLSGLHPFIKTYHVRISDFMTQVCQVEPPEKTLGFDPISDLTAVRKPTVYMLVADVLLVHQVCIENLSLLCDGDDRMGEMIEKIGRKTPTLGELLGVNTADEQELSQTQLTLSLSCSHNIPVSPSSSREQNLFLRTKKLVVDLMLCQAGDSLSTMLQTAPTNEERLKYIELVGTRKTRAEQNRFSYDPSQVSSLDELQTIVTENLQQLEELGRVTHTDDYQALVSAIAHDVRHERQYRARRHDELARLRKTIAALESKQKYFDDSVEYYRQYIAGCLQNLAPKVNKRPAAPQTDDSTTANGKQRRSWTSQNKAIRYNGDKLLKKNLIVHKDHADKSAKGLTVEFKSSETPGSFEAVGKFAGEKESQTSEIRFQDLLQEQYDGNETVQLFNKVDFNVNELIYFLNKKFLM